MEDYKVYVGKDGRTRVYLKDSKRVISYPRFLMEQKLGRVLRSNEQVHHIDGDPLNNDLDNLEVKLLGAHQREHNPSKYEDRVIVCAYCGKSFTWTAKQQRTHNANVHRKDRPRSDKVFCSKHCSGAYGKSMQITK